jgi:hypothetical protein
MGDLVVHKGVLKEPFEARFDRENLKTILPASELNHLFPDFSDQEKKRQEVF